MSLDRILNRERVEVELLGDGRELRRVGPVQADPCDPFAAPAGGVERGQALGRSDPLAVTIDRAVNDHGLGLCSAGHGRAVLVQTCGQPGSWVCPFFS